jgi:hypothetical protein
MVGMQSEKRKLTLSRVIVTVGLPLMAVAFYFAAYFATARRLDDFFYYNVVYNYQWQVEVFKPAAFMESLVTRKHVRGTTSRAY